MFACYPTALVKYYGNKANYYIKELEYIVETIYPTLSSMDDFNVAILNIF